MATREPGEPVTPPLQQEPETAARVERLRAAYDRTHARLWRAVLSWSGSREVADEATAEAFAQAARRIDDIRDVDAWVWRSGFRIAAGELHRRNRRDVPVGTGAEVLRDQAATDQPLTGFGLAEVVVDLIGALEKLTDQQRACVVFRDVAGLSVRQTADALGTTQSVVRVQALRGRRKLRDLLEAHDD